MKCEEMKYRKVSDLHLLPDNPCTITKVELQILIDSIRINGFYKHRPIALVEKGGKLYVLCGNQRLKAARKLKLDEVPTVLYSDLTEDEETELILRDNKRNGQWDVKMLTKTPRFAKVDFGYMGISFNKDEDKPKKKGKKETASTEDSDTDTPNDANGTEDNDTDDEQEDKEAFYRSMFKDVLYESDNEFEIPNLLLEQQAGKVELPLTPWGANSRLTKGVATYHFYVDDY